MSEELNTEEHYAVVPPSGGYLRRITNEPPTQEWRIVIGRTGTTCEVWCDGVQLTNIQSADLHLVAGQPSVLNLRLAPRWKLPPEGDTAPCFHDGDTVIAEGIPRVYIDIDGHYFRVLERMPEGDTNDGLFADRRPHGDAHESL